MTTAYTQSCVAPGDTVVAAAAAATITEKAAPVLQSPIQSIVWAKVVELCYSLPNDSNTTILPTAATATNETVTSSSKRSKCFSCGKHEEEATAFKLCVQCKVAKYCCRDCQVLDWKKQHKRACASYQRMVCKLISHNSNGDNVTNNNDSDTANDEVVGVPSLHSTSRRSWVLRSDELKCTVRDEFFGKIRFYICPYAVIRYMELGRGFVFLQTHHTLDIISLSVPIDCDGHPVVGVRGCSVHYLTVGEYDQEVCRDDFEMTIVRQELRTAIAQYDPMKQIVVLMRFRCGHVAVGTTALVPDYKLCQQLGRDYNNPSTNIPIGCLQLNIDE